MDLEVVHWVDVLSNFERKQAGYVARCYKDVLHVSFPCGC